MLVAVVVEAVVIAVVVEVGNVVEVVCVGCIGRRYTAPPARTKATTAATKTPAIICLLYSDIMLVNQYTWTWI